MRVCKLEGCNKKHHANGYCRKHNLRVWRSGHPFKKPTRTCNVDGCDRKHVALGFCCNHYWQMREHGKILKKTMFDPNEIIIKGDIAEIILCNQKCQEVARAIIDTEDIEKVENYKWAFGAYHHVTTMIEKNSVGIQNIIMGFKPIKNRIIDHKDRNPLNNRKSNFRFCTNAENSRNSSLRKTNKSGFKGVSWRKDRKRWTARIKLNGKQLWVGTFKDKLKAAKAYNAAAIKYHGEFAGLNNT